MTIEQGVCVGLLILLLFIIVKHSMKRVYRFHRTTCPACVASKEEWDKFASSCMFTMIHPIAVDLDLPANKSLGAEFDVQSVPSVILVKPSGANIKYNGERKSEAYMNWASYA